MDKYEYKVRADEIKTLIAEGDYAQAADIADTIDWRRVKSVMMLCTVSDLYKINRRYEDAKNMLLLAYERRPGGRTICYSLCELCIKTEEFVQALRYYKEFVQASPKDSSRFVLQYKLYEAQDVSLEERIGVLEELKKRDYREKWAYELAFLYHRVGLATRCVEECDEMILWFGEGKYVTKAMELKMLHQPLTPAQQDMYDHRFDKYEDEMQPDEGGQEEYIQEELQQADEQRSESEQIPASVETEPEKAQPEEMDIQVKTVDVGKYNTINLQAELAAGLQEVLGKDDITRSIVAPMMETDASIQNVGEQENFVEAVQDAETVEETEVFFGETGDMSGIPEETPEDNAADIMQRSKEDAAVDIVQRSEEDAIQSTEDAKAKWAAVGQGVSTDADIGSLGQMDSAETGSHQSNAVQVDKTQPGDTKVDHSRMTVPPFAVQPPKELADVLSQEANGQISLVVPDAVAVEKQLTGQMKIEDVLAEWAKMKKEREERYKEEVRQRVLKETGPMFTEFEAAVRDGLLEQLENGTAPENIGADLSMKEASAVQAAVDGESVPESDIGENAVLEETEETGQEGLADQESYRGAAEVLPAELEYIEDGEEQPDDLEAAWNEEEQPDQGEYIEDGEELSAELEYEEEEQTDEGEFIEEEDPSAELEYEEEEQSDELDGIEDEKEPPAELEYLEDEGTESSQEVMDEESEALEEPVKERKRSRKSRKGAASEEEHAGEETRDQKDSDQEVETKGSTTEEEDDEETPIRYESAKVRVLTREEKELYAPFIQSRSSREQLVRAIDNISMAAYTGNIIITGEEGMDTLTLAKNMIREVRMMDSNFSGKVAKVTGQGLNDRNIAETVEKLNNGALIIQKASGMSSATAEKLHKQLQQERLGIIVVLEDTRKAIGKLFAKNPDLAESFTARIDLEALSNDTLVSFGRLYAREMEYSIDDLGVLALHTRIEELQTIDHVVTVIEVKQIVDEAISRASRKTLGHFFDILFAKRYDNEDMVILTEKDFVA